MSDRKQQPAQLKRRISVLEGQLQAERERAEQAWDGYRKASYELVELRLRQEAAVKALRGEA